MLSPDSQESTAALLANGNRPTHKIHDSRLLRKVFAARNKQETPQSHECVRPFLRRSDLTTTFRKVDASRWAGPCSLEALVRDTDF